MAMSARQRLAKLIHHWPTRFLTICTVIAQAGSLDYYLVAHLGNSWYGIIAMDVIVIFIFIAAMFMARKCIQKEKPHEPNVQFSDSSPLPLGFIAWLLYGANLVIKVAVIFNNFAHDLKEHNFFGENTLKTSIALDGLVFVSFLATQHNIKPHTERRAAVEELTGTLLFDVLDGVDALDILLDKEAHDRITARTQTSVIAISCITFLLPFLSFLTLSVTRYGLKESSDRLVRWSKITVGYMVNLPLFIIRMVLWHGLSEGISIFALKNLIFIGMVTFELLEMRMNRMNRRSDEPDSINT